MCSSGVNFRFLIVVFQFGESQKLRLVRILRSTVMVRVGGGWVALDEFLLKNDPCRGKCLYDLQKDVYIVRNFNPRLRFRRYIYTRCNKSTDFTHNHALSLIA